MTTFILYANILLIALQLLSRDLTNASPTLCGTADLRGPLYENGLSPLSKSMLNLQPSSNDSLEVHVTCQLNIPENETGTYNGRLRIYFTCDRKECELLSQNGSDARLSAECEGISYTYYKQSQDGIMNFTYAIPWIHRMDRSVVTCGVNYHPGGGIPARDCFLGSAALVIFQDNPTCSTPPSTTAITEGPPTTQMPPNETTTFSTIFTNSTTTTHPITEEVTSSLATTEAPVSTTTTVTARSDAATAVVETNTVIYIVTTLAAVILILIVIVLILMVRVLQLKNKLSEYRYMVKGSHLVGNDTISKTTTMLKNGNAETNIE